MRSMHSIFASSRDRFNFPKMDILHYGNELTKAIKHVQKSGQLILGAGVAQFENDFSLWLSPEQSYANVIGVANGTDALEIALASCGVKAGDYVALPSFTAYATAAAVTRLGAKHLFVDVDPIHGLLCPYSLEAILSEQKESVKAIIAVHLYGQSCSLDLILRIAKKYGIPLVEDCAQACGTFYKDKHVGTFGSAASFSFYPTKNLSACGDGGAVLVNSHQAYEYSRRYRFYGWDENKEAVQMGVNSRLDEIQSFLLSAKLKDLKKAVLKRRLLAKEYSKKLSKYLSSGLIISLPSDGDEWENSYHLYVIRIKKVLRDQIIAKAKQDEIPLAIHYEIPCHKHQYSRFGGSLPNTCAWAETALSLPLNPYMRVKDVMLVCNYLEEFFRHSLA